MQMCSDLFEADVVGMSVIPELKHLGTIYLHPHILVKVTPTRSSWLNCALRDDEAVYWVSIGHYEAVAVGN